MLPDYSYVGTGRDDGENGGVSPEENATYLQSTWQLTEGIQPGFLQRLEISWITGISR